MSDMQDRDEGDIKDPPVRKKPVATDVHDGGAGDGEPEDELEVVDLDDPKGRETDDEDGERRGSSRRRNKSRSEKNAERAAAEARDKTRIAQLSQQNSELADRLAALEGRQSDADKREVANSIANVEAAIANLRARKARAIAAIGQGEGDPQALEEIDEALYGLREQHKDLKSLKERGGEKRAERGEERGGGERKVSPAETAKITEFLDTHPWIDVRGGDEDSRVALAIDRKMGQEGLRPSSPGWENEFRDRLAKALPHRFSDDDEDDDRPQRRRSAPTGGRGREGGSSRRTVTLNAERKAMLADGGHEPGSASYKRILNAWAKVDEAERGR